MKRMTIGQRWRAFETVPAVRWVLLGVGILLLPLAAIISPIPGPGGIPVAIAGLTLILRYSQWSKRLYVRFKRRWPHHGRWTDWGLRRASAKRRAQLERGDN